MTDQLYCPKCGPDWHGAYDMNHRCVACGEALKAEKVMEKLKALEEERDALAAYVEQMTDAACSEGAGPKMRAAIDDGPTTSLERQKVLWQAEALEELADWLPSDYEGAEFQAGIEQARRHAEDRAAQTRRQAEEGS